MIRRSTEKPIGEYDEALRHLDIAAEKVRSHEADAGFWALNNLRMNITADPALERPEFRAVLSGLRGD